jgi:aspartate ammonia-lyase
MVSTALVESYRDKAGRPRQRLLANLHGEPDTLHALAKLAARRDALRKEKESLAARKVEANRFYEIVTQETLAGRQFSAEKRKEIDRLMRGRERLMKRLDKIDAHLAKIQKDGVVIKKHCSAKPDQILAAVKKFRKKLHDAEMLMLGVEFSRSKMLKEYKAKLRRLSS